MNFRLGFIRAERQKKGGQKKELFPEAVTVASDVQDDGSTPAVVTVRTTSSIRTFFALFPVPCVFVIVILNVSGEVCPAFTLMVRVSSVPDTANFVDSDVVTDK